MTTTGTSRFGHYEHPEEYTNIPPSSSHLAEHMKGLVEGVWILRISRVLSRSQVMDTVKGNRIGTTIN